MPKTLNFSKQKIKGQIIYSLILIITVLALRELFQTSIEYYNIKLNPKYSQKPKEERVIDSNEDYYLLDAISSNDEDLIYVSKHTQQAYTYSTKNKQFQETDKSPDYKEAEHGGYYLTSSFDDTNRHVLKLYNPLEDKEISITSEIKGNLYQQEKTQQKTEIESSLDNLKPDKYATMYLKDNNAFIAKMFQPDNQATPDILLLEADLDSQTLNHEILLSQITQINPAKIREVHNLYLHYYNETYFLIWSNTDKIFYTELSINKDNLIKSAGVVEIATGQAPTNWKFFANFSAIEDNVNILTEYFGGKETEQQYQFTSFKIKKNIDSNTQLQLKYKLESNTNTDVTDLVKLNISVPVNNTFYTNFQCSNSHCYIIKLGVPLNYLEFMPKKFQEGISPEAGLTLTKISTGKSPSPELTLNFADEIKDFYNAKGAKESIYSRQTNHIQRQIIWNPIQLFPGKFSWNLDDQYVDYYYTPSENGVNKIRIKL